MNSQWYKEAIIYETHIRAFYDSDGDGIGDLRGLTQKLEYLQDLGITALWLLPFYPSPLRDDGYDIADYTNVHPNYGTLRDFKAFLREAHRRGLRVITELVLNHTSDQHPWFQRARRSPRNSRWRDFYVWSDTPEKYKETRVIFQDFEPSNWTWDPVAEQYYWHRFYSHQPDLNFDNIGVRRALLDVLNFWLGMGVDGLRLDAVPYLYEREGTNCENLPETHNYLRTLRKYIDERYADRMLLAEANQWPDDAIAYFGLGDECQMAFHFPLMPRLFMAVRMEDRFPIIEILEQTPVIPQSCQWALFLRNHDEMTLEMVTDEERDYMYRVYAADSQARINLGIRRRLAPLLSNNRRKIELMNGLLFSLPGAPIIYYGDEIGMGDNIYLGDRNGVRTPMQWSGDRNAGFSRANPQKLYLPIITDSAYHYQTVNVETQMANLNSVLWWMKRLIALRKRYPVFGLGSTEFLFPENRKVLAFIRRYNNAAMLVVANLSRYVQPVKLNLNGFKAATPIELFGQTRFPLVNDEPYLLTLGPHSFYWFDLERLKVEISAVVPPRLIAEIPVEDNWQEVFKKPAKERLEAALAKWLPKCRWFIGKNKVVQRVQIVDVILIPTANPPRSTEDKITSVTERLTQQYTVDRRASAAGYADFRLLLLQVEYTEGEPEVYQVPVHYMTRKEKLHHTQSNRVIAKLITSVVNPPQPAAGSAFEGWLVEAVDDPRFAGSLLETIRRRRQYRGQKGEINAAPLDAPKLAWIFNNKPIKSRLMGAEQSNSSISFGDKAMLKLFRRVERGANPEYEMGRFLTEKHTFANTPKLLGVLEYCEPKEKPATLGVLLEYIPNEGDAAKWTIDCLKHYFEAVLSEAGRTPPPVESRALLDLAKIEPPPLAREVIGAYLESARVMGRRTAELHLVLASDPEDPAFSPEPFGELYQRALSHGLLGLADQALGALESKIDNLPTGTAELARKLVDYREVIEERFKRIRERRIHAMRLRTHGDYHLGQVLCKGADFIIIDFEGEPLRSIGERRIKRSPLKDVAGMLRSFHYVWELAARQLVEPAAATPQGRAKVADWGRFWQMWVSAEFLKEYLAVAAAGEFLPADRKELELLLNALILERALYEIGYELNTRSNWVEIPLRGTLQALEA